jgi:hypothetical protein
MTRDRDTVLRELMIIPGVGKRVSYDLYSLGMRSIADVARQDPEELYARLCREAGMHIDMCMLYVMRSAVYYARTPEDRRDPELLKWWNWKGRGL